jgi:Zn-dependent protease
MERESCMFNFLDIGQLILWLPAVLIALTFHEYAHGLVADWLGDPTPRYQGRLTLNPLVHLDPLGFILLLLVHFGWAKPVQVNPLNFRGDRYRGMVLVGLAGVSMNLLVAFTATLVARLAGVADATIAALEGISPATTGYLPAILAGIIVIDIYLALFNLIPIPPLDGAQVLAGLLRRSDLVYTLQRYGFIILIVLIFTGVVGDVLIPVTNVIINLLSLISFGIAHLVGM